LTDNLLKIRWNRQGSSDGRCDQECVAQCAARKGFP